ncbi:15579_t:CDS:2 [Funneliformis geosporum]|uniref:2441_t:CDS:1 n=1 Tax=Funneliformis geosporum TaxID=1117311 RepID=A0A9W4SSC4_9GLOM|nr:15579_t:CDS:2 [Funneliformis geosporum]CAI2177396.1 2441_t:CDS:2 [Funneliformis geosporum]
MLMVSIAVIAVLLPLLSYMLVQAILLAAAHIIPFIVVVSDILSRFSIDDFVDVR